MPDGGNAGVGRTADLIPLLCRSDDQRRRVLWLGVVRVSSKNAAPERIRNCEPARKNVVKLTLVNPARAPAGQPGLQGIVVRMGLPH